MRNLRQPVAKILINSLTATNGSLRVGLYEDYVKKVKVLTFKEEGINIFGGPATGTAAVPAVPLATGSLFAGLTASCGCTDPGKEEFQVVEIQDTMPCDPCDFGYGITIEKHVKMPGVQNNENNRYRKSYGGVVANIGTGTVIALPVLEDMTDDIVSQISSDLGMFSGNNDPVTASWSPVNAHKAYTITISTGLTFTIISNGITTVITSATDAQTTCSLVNAGTTAAYVRAFVVQDNAFTSDVIMVMSRNNGDAFTITAGSATVSNPQIALVAKSAKVQFAVQYTLGFATTTKHNLVHLRSSTAAGTTTINVIYNGVSYTAAAANDAVSTAQTYADNLQVVIDAMATPPDDIAAAFDTFDDTTYIYGSSNIDSINLTFSALSTTTIADEWSGTGKWPWLTGEDVFKIFWNQKDAGKYSAMTYLDQVNPDDEYCFFSLKVDNNIYAIHGANHSDIYNQEIEIYVKSSLLNTNILDSTNPAGLSLGTTYNQQPDTNAAATVAFTVDTSFGDILQIWAGDSFGCVDDNTPYNIIVLSVSGAPTGGSTATITIDGVPYLITLITGLNTIDLFITAAAAQLTALYGFSCVPDLTADTITIVPGFGFTTGTFTETDATLAGTVALS